jgi:hypothetical protein
MGMTAQDAGATSILKDLIEAYKQAGGKLAAY